jgi:8-oxo-dGTP pyrophosphatase MutT (NUDIX family)
MSFIQNIKKQLSAPLPGKSAQIKMMRTDLNQTLKDHYFDPLKEAKKACVMLLLYPVDDHWCTAVMQRPESPYAHSRQISLPGGRLEDTDQSLEAGAKRETLEEFGIPPKDIQTLGRLSNLYIPVSNFFGTSFCRLSQKKAQFYTRPQRSRSNYRDSN